LEDVLAFKDKKEQEDQVNKNKTLATTDQVDGKI
jgi:hypothetical protein